MNGLLIIRYTCEWPDDFQIKVYESLIKAAIREIMSSNIQRSSSVGAQPRPKKLFTSRAESVAAVALDVRCACQFFQTTSLLPERVNPVGSRPTSSLGYSPSRPSSRNQLDHDLHIFEPNLQRDNSDAELLTDNLGSNFSFGEVIGDTDYYAESVVSSRPHSPNAGGTASRFDDENVAAANLDNSSPHHMITTGGASSQCLLHQKDPTNSVLLQRRASRMSDHQPPTTVAQIDPTKSVLLQRRSVQRSMESVAIKQLDPCSSTLLMRKRSVVQQQNQLQSPDQVNNNDSYTFKPIVPVVTKGLHSPPPAPPPTNYPRGPYPGEAYPNVDAYPVTKPIEETKPEEQPTFGIGIVELLSLGTSLVQRREQRYCERSNEDIRGRSRRSRKEKAEKEKQDKEERRKEKEAANERKMEEKLKKDRKTPEPDAGVAPTISALVTANVERSQQETRQTTPPPPPPHSLMDNIGAQISSVGDKALLIDHKKALDTVTPKDNSPITHVAKPTIEQPIVNYHETTPAPKVTKNVEVSVAANSIISTLMTNPLTSRELAKETPASEATAAPQVMRQRDPSQSSLLRNRYSSDRDVGGGGVVVRQRDPSQSSMLRQRYSIDRDAASSPVSAGSFMRQRDPSQSSMLRQRYSVSTEQASVGGSQTNLQNNLMQQKDPSTSSLLMQKRMHARSHSQDNYGPVEKISKTVSFEHDKKLTASGQVADVFDVATNKACTKAEFVQRMQKMSTEMRDKMDWIERTYNMR